MGSLKEKIRTGALIAIIGVGSAAVYFTDKKLKEFSSEEDRHAVSFDEDAADLVFQPESLESALDEMSKTAGIEEMHDIGSSDPSKHRWSENIDKSLWPYLDDAYNPDSARFLPRVKIEEYVKTDIKEYGADKLLNSSYFSLFSKLSDKLAPIADAPRSMEFDVEYSAQAAIADYNSELEEQGLGESRLSNNMGRIRKNMVYSLIAMIEDEIEDCHENMSTHERREIMEDLGIGFNKRDNPYALLGDGIKRWGLMRKYCREHGLEYLSSETINKYETIKKLSEKLDIGPLNF